MKPGTTAYLVGADKALVQAQGNLGIGYPDQAARLAYYAQFHAAQALIFERTNGVAKTHKGVRRLFHNLIRTEADLDPSLAATLTNSYQYKQLADYETGTSVIVTSEVAADAIAAAERCVVAIRRALTPPLLPPATANDP